MHRPGRRDGQDGGVIVRLIAYRLSMPGPARDAFLKRAMGTPDPTIHFIGKRSRVLVEASADAVNTTGAGRIVHDLELLPGGT